MRKDYQNTDCISESTANDVASKPGHEIRAEIVSVEVVGEDTPRKHSKKQEAWSVIAWLSLVVLVICLPFFAFKSLSVSGFLAIGGSFTLFLLSVIKLVFISYDDFNNNTV